MKNSNPNISNLKLATALLVFCASPPTLQKIKQKNPHNNNSNNQATTATTATAKQQQQTHKTNTILHYFFKL